MVPGPGGGMRGSEEGEEEKEGEEKEEKKEKEEKGKKEEEKEGSWRPHGR